MKNTVSSKIKTNEEVLEKMNKQRELLKIIKER